MGQLFQFPQGPKVIVGFPQADDGPAPQPFSFRNSRKLSVALEFALGDKALRIPGGLGHGLAVAHAEQQQGIVRSGGKTGFNQHTIRRFGVCRGQALPPDKVAVLRHDVGPAHGAPGGSGLLILAL